MSEQIWALVVTFNRVDLLAECLGGVRAQSRPLDGVLVVDNGSTDGTREFLAEYAAAADRPLEQLLLENNSGSAGGFRRGLEWLDARRVDWIWTMDDDMIPHPDALQKLIDARNQFPAEEQPELLACNVVWTDGAQHPMNRQWPKQDDASLFYRLAAEGGMQSIRATTWVGMLMRRSLIERFGLPMAEYRLWSDDIEYTGRILREANGVLVPESKALHKTASKHTVLDAAPDRLYLHVRNTLWMLLRSHAWSLRERLRQLFSLLLVMQSRIRHSPARGAMVRAIFRGLRDGMSAPSGNRP